MRLFHLWLGILFALITIKWGDWKNWKKYYSTLLFIIAGNLYYNVLTNDNSLWKWSSETFSHNFIDMIWASAVYPAIIFIFIPYYPRFKSIAKQFKYIIYYVVFFSVLEYIMHKLGEIKYYNGWEFWHSILVYVALFPTLIIHHRKPIVGWIIFFTIAYLVLYIFGLPFRILAISNIKV